MTTGVSCTPGYPVPHSTHPRSGGPTAEQVLAQTGLTYREVDYWLRAGVVRLDCTDCVTPGSGRARWFTAADIERLKAARQMRDDGFAFTRIRRTYGRIPEAVST